ncbi:hypothetical protein MTO96_046566 [Rhipicephalus appendiculatus]
MPLRPVSVVPSSSASFGLWRCLLTWSSTPDVAAESSAVVALVRVRTADPVVDSAADSSFVVDLALGSRALEAGFGSCCGDGCVLSSFFAFFFLHLRQRQGTKAEERSSHLRYNR